MDCSNSQDSDRDLSSKINLLRIAASGVLDSIQCPNCKECSVSVRFTHPADNEYRTWFVCSNCDFRLRVHDSGRPSHYSETLVDEHLQAYDSEILRKRRL